MPNGGPHGDHFAEGQYAWGYKEGYAQGYREALKDAVDELRMDSDNADVLFKKKFPKKEPTADSDLPHSDSEFLPSDVPRESDDDGTD